MPTSYVFWKSIITLICGAILLSLSVVDFLNKAPEKNNKYIAVIFLVFFMSVLISSWTIMRMNKKVSLKNLQKILLCLFFILIALYALTNPITRDISTLIILLGISISFIISSFLKIITPKN